jgi:Mn2+/Fe2+ NRAMP family transporter
VSILDVAARSVQGGGAHKSKSAVAAFVAVAMPVLAALAWLAPDATLGFSILCMVICLPVSAFSCLMFFANRRHWAES